MFGSSMGMVLSGLFVVLVAAGRASGLSSVIRRYSDLGGQPYALSRDGRSLVVNGSRVLLLSGSIHYVRSTPEMWPQLFAEARANGLNAIESYVFWNAHAPTRSGPYDYSGNRDVARFLSLAAEHPRDGLDPVVTQAARGVRAALIAAGKDV